jgi:hypothetical protein
VDGTMFLEFLPGNKQYLLTFLSVWWAVGQVVGSLISWAFLANYGCETREWARRGYDFGPVHGHSTPRPL